MLVDTLLRMIGSNPDAYFQESGKWSTIFFHLLFNYFFPSLPWVLAIIPWVYFFIKRDKHKKDIKKFIWKIAKYSVAGFLLGYFTPWLIGAILGSLAAYSMYGGTI